MSLLNRQNYLGILANTQLIGALNYDEDKIFFGYMMWISSSEITLFIQL